MWPASLNISQYLKKKKIFEKEKKKKKKKKKTAAGSVVIGMDGVVIHMAYVTGGGVVGIVVVMVSQYLKPKMSNKNKKQTKPLLKWCRRVVVMGMRSHHGLCNRRCRQYRRCHELPSI